MKIHLVTPSPPRFNNGNKITAVRWVSILRRLGHQVLLTRTWEGQGCDASIALHARRSHDSIKRFHERHPDRPLILVLTGTDLYHDIHHDRAAQESLALATRIVGLQRMAFAELPRSVHKKTTIIYQSAEPMKTPAPRWHDKRFRVCVVGHLRAEKDPLRTAMAARKLPAGSRIEIVHVGRSLDEKLGARLAAEVARNPRYRWLGELSHARTRKLLAQSHLTVISSKMEGSSNVLSEALASGVPVLATRISGLVGTLGQDYSGYFEVGDTNALTRLLAQAANDSDFYRELKKQCRRIAPLVNPQRELRAWRALLKQYI